ncbi:MAG: diguanylate cyclase domain-containing protein [Velocimicrobium sp.]
MNEMTYELLDHISEGILILNDKLELIYWNQQMERITKCEQPFLAFQPIEQAMPNLSKKCFMDAFLEVSENGLLRFFSAMMHRELVIRSEYFNLKIERIKNEGEQCVLLEFMNVSSQISQINELKIYVKELWMANKELREKEKIIRNLAYYDKLTKVANRTLFYELAEDVFDKAKGKNTLIGLMFIDVNKFKTVNDTYGHEIGDQILVRVADMLVQATRQHDVVARYGGDEFLVLLPSLKDRNNIEIIASRIINFKNRPLMLDGHSISITLSMGIAFYPYDAQSIEQLIIEADKAMYMAKRQDGEDNYCRSACNL